MAKITPMAPDSAGFQTLLRLYDAGGKRSVEFLTAELWSDFRSPARFHKIAGQPLLERGWVKLQSTQRGDFMHITAEGRLIVQRHRLNMPTTAAAPSSIFKPLKAAVFRYEERRPGSHDYRKMPSVMGGERVPYHAGPDEAPGK